MNHRLSLFLATLLLASAAAASDDVLVIGKSTYVGGDIDITEPVDGTLRAVGGDITVTGPVEGDAQLVGGKVRVTGSIGGKLRVAGGDVVIDGPVGGDASIAGGKLVLGPNARIEGTLKFHGGDLRQDPAAVVTGGVEHVQGRKRNHNRHNLEPFGSTIAFWIWTAGLMALAALIAGALPGPVRRMSDELVAHPWHAPLLGFIALTGIPIAAVLIMLTIIGIPIGLLAIVGYLALLLVGYVSVSIVVGGLLLEHFNAEAARETAWRVGVAALAVLVLALLTRIPVFGGLVVFAALLVGVGLIVATIWRRNKPEAPAAIA